MAYTIRLLTAADWEIWRSIRLESLQRHPDLFATRYEDALQKPDDSYKNALRTTQVFGAFDGDEVVGVARLAPDVESTQPRTGELISVYLKQAYRGKGLADQLTQAVIDHARAGFDQLRCVVVETNSAAIKLYQRHGFKIVGKAAAHATVDEVTMTLELSND